MILTVPLLSKGSFLGSLINKCRQVIRIKPVKKIETNIETNISTSIKTTTPTSITYVPPPPPVSSLTTEQQTNRPASVANLSLSSPLNVGKSLEEKAGLPPKPKRPLTPFFRYMSEQRPKIKAASPHLSLVDLVKQVSQQWVTADVALKQRFQEEYRKEQLKYIENRAKYDSKISDEQRSQLRELKQEIFDAKERRMMRKRIKQLGRPKKPASPFFLFVAHERKVTPQTSNETYRQWHQKAADKWGKLADEQKSVYMNEARKEMEKYKKEISLWEEKMIRLGNIDVVRHKNLIDPPEFKPRIH